MIVDDHSSSKKFTLSEITSLGIGMIVFFVVGIYYENVIYYYQFINKDFFYSLSFGILSWASIQAAALLAMYLHLQSEIKNFLPKEKENKKSDENYFEIMYKKHQPIFKMYARSLFRGWIISFILAIMGLGFIVANPNITILYVYLLGTLMFSMFVSLLVLLFMSIAIYHSIFKCS